MSTTDEVNFDKPTPKKRRAPKKSKAAAPRDTRPPAPFPGLTRTACATACNAKGCSISGMPVCSHPTKGGLPPVLLNDGAALKRMQAARDQIDVRIDPDRFKD